MDKLRSSIDELLKITPKPQMRFILISNGNLLLKNNEIDYLFTHDEVESLKIPNIQSIFLGIHESIYYFTQSLNLPEIHSLKTTDLRSFANSNLYQEEEMGMAAQAVSISEWHKTHRFCPHCGHETEYAHGGWRRDCIGCEKEHFPRTDPVVIMLVTHDDYCLLGSGRDFSQTLYSCLAGFMEPGETIEDAARRELFEEAGIIGTEVHYISSQPWPFPFSLMIGVHVKASNMELNIDHSELADARWIKKSEVASVLNGATDLGFLLPPKIAIARTLLEFWVSTSAT